MRNGIVEYTSHRFLQKVGIFILISCISILAGLWSLESYAAINYVPDDYPTIQAAVDAASSGDTVIVRDGTYTENVVVSKDHLTIKSENGAEATIVYAANSNDPVFEITGDYVNISGFGAYASYAIYLMDVNHCEIKGNRIDSNGGGSGISVIGGLDNILTDNIVMDNYVGIGLSQSINTTLRNNLISGNSINFHVAWTYKLSHFIHDIDISNKVDGKPIYYWVNEHDKQVPSDAGYVGIVNSTNIIVKDLTLTNNNGEGVLFAGTENSRIENVHASENVSGIRLFASSNNTIIDCVFSENTWGIWLRFCSENNILENNYAFKNVIGIDLEGAHNNMLTNNTAENNIYGIELNSYGNTLRNNLMSGNRYNFSVGGGCTADIDISNKVDGKPIYYWVNEHDKQVPSDAGYVGIVNSTNIIVKDLTLTNNGEGVVFAGTENSRIENVHASENDSGIRLRFSKNITIENNILSNNKTSGIELFDSHNNTISRNSVLSNSGGIHMYWSNNNRITRNNFVDNETDVGYVLSEYQTNTNTWNSSEEITYTYNGKPYKGYLGNYWGNYAGSNAGKDADGDGIGDNPYSIDADNEDDYPLMEPFENYRVGELTDTDSDTLPDSWENQYFGNLDQGPDEDYDTDGLTNLEEYNYGTDPTEEDSDNDGYTDKEEINAGTDPIDSNDFPISDITPPIISNVNTTNITQTSATVTWTTDEPATSTVIWGTDTNYQDGISSSGDLATSHSMNLTGLTAGTLYHYQVESTDASGNKRTSGDFMFNTKPLISKPVITSSLEITPEKDIYCVGEIINAKFTIKNRGYMPIAFDILTVGGRLNGFCPTEGCPDFTHHTVTLQPDELYQYQGSFTPNQQGNYRFFAAYHIGNPNPEEKKLLDENNWNTCIDVEVGLNHADRVENVIVYKENTIPEEVSQLRKLIEKFINMDRIYPTYLLDPEVSWAASVWTNVSSVWTDVQEKYEELWFAGVDHGNISRIEAIYAKSCLDRGNIDSAREHLQNSILHDKISYRYFVAAAEVFDRNVKMAEEMVKSTLKLIEVGATILNPAAGKFASYIFMVPNYIADRDLVGEEKATKNLIRDTVFKVFFSEYKFEALNGRTLENALNNRIGQITFPYIQSLFKNNEAAQFYLSRAFKKALDDASYKGAIEFAELSKKILDGLSECVQSRIYQRFSPIELRVCNSKGQITGILNGKIRHEISRSFYRNGTITIFFPSDFYTSEVIGKEEGKYGLDIASVENGEETTFAAIDIPTSATATHQYTIDWSALSENKQGVTVQIDADGDGDFEKSVFADNELTQDEFLDISQEALDLNSGWNLISLNMQPTDTTIATVLEPINGKYISVWAYQDASWNVYDPLHSGFTDLTAMSSGLGYWVNMKEPAFITFSGNASTSSIPLTAGWNLVGYNSAFERQTPDALASIAGNYISVWAYINGGWKVYDPANPGLTDLTIMEPGYGYWIKTTQACTWTLP